MQETKSEPNYFAIQRKISLVYIDDTQSDTADTGNTKDEATWFWNESVNETESDLEDGGKSDVEEPSLDLALPGPKRQYPFKAAQKRQLESRCCR